MALGTQDPNYLTADLNDDGEINILDVVQIVNMILEGRGEDATNASIVDKNGVVTLKADGYIGGIQMTLSHSENFKIHLTNEALLSDYVTNNGETKLIIVAPSSEEIFTAVGDYEIVDMIIANSSSSIDVLMPEVISLDPAYPNPFNPSTSIRLYMPSDGFADIKIYNTMGQQVDELYSGNISSGYTSFNWNASDLSSGMYIVRAISNQNIATQKIMLIK
tara:strand:- start:334 stop:993 length:660 start_codon:yes stop_codon:yes gene_type:complete